jgi:hypothetical protein
VGATVCTPVTTPGHMIGAGGISATTATVRFAFDVREQVPVGERGAIGITIDYRAKGVKTDVFASITVGAIAFSDDPGFRPGHTPLPTIDTVVFTGTGYWNGAAGYTYVVHASDRGEPGRGSDTFDVTISDPHGVVVATYSGVLSEGNIQSLRLAGR